MLFVVLASFYTPFSCSFANKNPFTEVDGLFVLIIHLLFGGDLCVNYENKIPFGDEKLKVAFLLSFYRAAGNPFNVVILHTHE